MSVTDEQLAEWKRLADGATPGPWVQRRKPAGRYGSGEQWHVHSEAADAGCVSCRLSDGPEAEPDAAFIAAARTAVTALIDEVERLRAELSASQRRTRIYTCPAVDADGRTCGEIVAEAGHGCGECLETMGVIAKTATFNPKSACACAPPPARHLPDCPHFAEGA